MSSLWSLATILGPILLIGFIIWAFVKNCQAPDSTVRKAEEGARELREELDQEEYDRGER
jgi:plastocyanin domain-containing protein